MLRSSVLWGAALGLCLATAACAAPTNNEQAMLAPMAEPPPEIEEVLSYSIDALDVRHGTLRIEGSMEDGSADVSMWLGDGCAKREVGHGIATPSGFAWSLSRDEIAKAIECSLVVKVHAVDEDGQRVLRTAELPVSVSLQEDATESVHQTGQSSDGATTTLSFAAPVAARRLHVAGSVIGVEEDDDEDDEPAERDTYVSRFVVDNDDLARSMLDHRHISLLGEQFFATITMASTMLDVVEPVTEPVVEDTVDADEERESEHE
jgi:hypothetical protein